MFEGDSLIAIPGAKLAILQKPEALTLSGRELYHFYYYRMYQKINPGAGCSIYYGEMWSDYPTYE